MKTYVTPINPVTLNTLRTFDLSELIVAVDFDGTCVYHEQAEWSLSPKSYAHVYIDDAALGCPLIFNTDHPRPFVDWHGVLDLLIRQLPTVPAVKIVRERKRAS